MCYNNASAINNGAKHNKQKTEIKLILMIEFSKSHIFKITSLGLLFER